MNHLQTMLDTHPRGAHVSRTSLIECLETCRDCSVTCSFCADACLSEEHVANLIRCIRLNLQCAAVCEATARLLAYPGGLSPVMRMQLLTCRDMCAACAEECEKHAGMHEHCRVCADDCRRCEQACESVVQTH